MRLNMRLSIKAWMERIPERVGRWFTVIPYWLRLGANYSSTKRRIHRWYFETESQETKLYEGLFSILAHASERVPFYRDFYDRYQIERRTIQTMSAWRTLPIVTRDILQRVPIAERTISGSRGFAVNTGGTSGQPLEFVLDKDAYAREWAHMHHVWCSRGYDHRHLKLTLRGKHFEPETPFRYNPIHNEYIVNANCPMNQVVDALSTLRPNRVIRWIHGYPSLVAEFAHALSCKSHDSLAVTLRSGLYGVLLGSEFPAPAYRSVIDTVLSSNTVSWYGHSEMAILARETAHGIYESLPTYGYAEAVSTEDGKHHRLICTSVHNRVHPFLRYDTGDIIEPVSEHAGSLAFRIVEGRVGDFITDRNGKRHALTAIIFGRHHSAFRSVMHVQVRDQGFGQVAIVVTPRSSAISMREIAQGFDLDDIPVDWSYEIVDSPIRTPSGKIRLKV